MPLILSFSDIYSLAPACLIAITAVLLQLSSRLSLPVKGWFLKISIFVAFASFLRLFGSGTHLTFLDQVIVDPTALILSSGLLLAVLFGEVLVRRSEERSIIRWLSLSIGLFAISTNDFVLYLLSLHVIDLGWKIETRRTLTSDVIVRFLSWVGVFFICFSVGSTRISDLIEVAPAMAATEPMFILGTGLLMLGAFAWVASWLSSSFWSSMGQALLAILVCRISWSGLLAANHHLQAFMLMVVAFLWIRALVIEKGFNGIFWAALLSIIGFSGGVSNSLAAISLAGVVFSMTLTMVDRYLPTRIRGLLISGYPMGLAIAYHSLVIGFLLREGQTWPGLAVALIVSGSFFFVDVRPMKRPVFEVGIGLLSAALVPLTIYTLSGVL